MESQSHRRLRRENILAGFGDVDIQDGLTIDLFRVGFDPDSSHQPVAINLRNMETRDKRTYVPDGGHSILARCQDCEVLAATQASETSLISGS